MVLQPKRRHSRLFLLLGAMLELGDNAPYQHEKLLADALKRFPDAQIFTFGRAFAQAAEKYGVRFFENPSDFSEELLKMITPGSIVFAKGSRGIGVENALPAAAK